MISNILYHYRIIAKYYSCHQGQGEEENPTELCQTISKLDKFLKDFRDELSSFIATNKAWKFEACYVDGPLGNDSLLRCTHCAQPINSLTLIPYKSIHYYCFLLDPDHPKNVILMEPVVA